MQVGVLDGQPQEVQDALVLRPGAHVGGDAVPVVAVQLQSFQEQERLLFCPFSPASATTVLSRRDKTRNTIIMCCSNFYRIGYVLLYFK